MTFDPTIQLGTLIGAAAVVGAIVRATIKIVRLVTLLEARVEQIGTQQTAQGSHILRLESKIDTVLQARR